MPTKPKRPILTTVEQSEQSLVYPFTEEEYRKVIATLKNNKAAGIDDVLVEQLTHIGPVVVVRLSVHVHFSLGLSPRDS